MFDINRAEDERAHVLGFDSEVWQRYLRIRNLVLEMGPSLGMRPEDRDGWTTFVFVTEAFQTEEGTTAAEIQSEAKEFLNRFLAGAGAAILDAHEAAMLYDQLLTQDRLEPHEALDRIGKLPEYPLEPEILAALISVIPQREPDLTIPTEEPDA